MGVSKDLLSAALLSSLILALAIHTARLIPDPVSAAAPPSLDAQELPR